jgi:diadenosine tetraphosphate (Ap4A) HIT family hydrolase
MLESCEYCQIKEGYGKKLTETSYWMIFLAPSQRYLGTCVVVLKRKCADLSQVNEKEWIDFAKIVKNMEISLKEIFNPTLFNWSCYKNSTFRKEAPDPEIHWHFLPRYKEEVSFGGISFEDPDFGFIPKPIKRTLPVEVQEKLFKILEQNLNFEDIHEL